MEQRVAYGITCGSYDDYRVESIWLVKDKAEERAEQINQYNQANGYNGDCIVEEFNLEPSIEDDPSLNYYERLRASAESNRKYVRTEVYSSNIVIPVENLLELKDINSIVDSLPEASREERLIESNILFTPRVSINRGTWTGYRTWKGHEVLESDTTCIQIIVETTSPQETRGLVIETLTDIEKKLPFKIKEPLEFSFIELEEKELPMLDNNFKTIKSNSN